VLTIKHSASFAAARASLQLPLAGIAWTVRYDGEVWA